MPSGPGCLPESRLEPGHCTVVLQQTYPDPQKVITTSPVKLLSAVRDFEEYTQLGYSEQNTKMLDPFALLVKKDGYIIQSKLTEFFRLIKSGGTSNRN